MKTLKHDVAIIGASMGGVAASIASAGRDVILVTAHDWIGGQMTAQGVSALDEHPYIEQFGGTRTYNEMRQRIRQHYIDTYNAPDIMRDGQPLNPGNGWVSRLCFEPKVGLQVLRDMMPDSVQMLVGYEAVSADVDDNIVNAVIVENADGDQVRVEAQYFLDATDTGELLPLTGTAYVTGAESYEQTGEPDAPQDARPDEVQSFTYCFAIEHHPGEDHTIDKPANYETMRDEQPYSLILHDKEGNERYFHMFKEDEEQGNLPFWTYRRIKDGSILGGRDLALINWHGNDYYGGNILDASPEEKARILDEAKQLALGFLYWLQTECPRNDGGYGYPEFKLIPEAMGTADGLSREPYIRESRRIKGMSTIVQQDIATENNPYARASNRVDSVGIGWYAIDLHPCVGNKNVSMYSPTKPFQIPLRALIPEQTKNLIPACKNISTTHLTNGAYRLHPIEWNIGESAMMLALFCVDNGTVPHVVAEDAKAIVRLQYRIVKHGIPIAWAVDVKQSDLLFIPTQMSLIQEPTLEYGKRLQQLEIMPDKSLDDVSIGAINAWMFVTITGNKSPHQWVMHKSEPQWENRFLTSEHTWAEMCQMVAPLIEEQFG